jgi:hypothetical protein
MNDHHKSQLLGGASSTRTIAGLLILVGAAGLVLAFVLGIITLNSMQDQTGLFASDSVSYTTSQRLIAVSTVGFGIGMPSLLLIGLGRLLTMSAIWFEVQGDAPAPQMGVPIVGPDADGTL